MELLDYCVFIGHFSPFSLDDEELLREALKQSLEVIVVLGSHNKARNIKTPWSTDRRIEMIESALTADELKRVHFVKLRDQLYNNTLWTTDLLAQVYDITGKSDSVGLICKEKNNSEYLKLFPQWELVTVKQAGPRVTSEDIRYRYFTYDTSYQRYVNPSVVTMMESFKDTHDFKCLKDDFDYIKEYKASWSEAPFPPTFVTVDSVTVCSAHILCVRRRGNPGKGLIALPGGFLDAGERIKDAVVRELREETVIKVTKEELKKCIKKSEVFDEPDRSLRGRTITHAFLIDLGSGALPQVKGDGNSDTDKAFWLPLNEVNDREADFFEDHFHIINYFVSQL